MLSYSAPWGRGLTWEEVTSEPPQREVVTDKEDSDWDANQDNNIPAESQSWAVSKQSSLRKETLMKTLTEALAESPYDDMLTEASVGPGSQDVMQIHMGNDDLDQASTPHKLLPKKTENKLNSFTKRHILEITLDFLKIVH